MELLLVKPHAQDQSNKELGKNRYQLSPCTIRILKYGGQATTYIPQTHSNQTLNPKPQ